MIDPVSIEPDAVFDDGALYLILGLTQGTLAEARRTGALCYTRQGHRTLYLGKWVLRWLESQATPDRASTTNAEARP
jgi:hypothetical protein